MTVTRRHLLAACGTALGSDLAVIREVRAMAGRVIEMGGFNELSATNGRFASLLRAGGLLTDEDVRRLSHTVQAEAAAA